MRRCEKCACGSPLGEIWHIHRETSRERNGAWVCKVEQIRSIAADTREFRFALYIAQKRASASGRTCEGAKPRIPALHFAGRANRNNRVHGSQGPCLILRRIRALGMLVQDCHSEARRYRARNMLSRHQEADSSPIKLVRIVNSLGVHSPDRTT